MRFDMRNKFLNIVRLREKAADPVVQFRARQMAGGQDHLYAGERGTNDTCEADAVKRPGHGNVREHNVDPSPALQDRERFISVGGLDDVIALLTKLLRDSHSLKHVVLNDEDRGRANGRFIERITVVWMRTPHGPPQRSPNDKTKFRGLGSSTTLYGVPTFMAYRIAAAAAWLLTFCSLNGPAGDGEPEPRAVAGPDPSPRSAAAQRPRRHQVYDDDRGPIHHKRNSS